MSKTEYLRIRNGVMDLFESLAQSQGSYGRLLREIKELESNGEDLTAFFELFKDCKDVVDIILTLEG